MEEPTVVLELNVRTEANDFEVDARRGRPSLPASPTPTPSCAPSTVFPSFDPLPPTPEPDPLPLPLPLEFVGVGIEIRLSGSSVSSCSMIVLEAFFVKRDLREMAELPCRNPARDDFVTDDFRTGVGVKDCVRKSCDVYADENARACEMGENGP